jgi:hypothetical protein
MEITNYTIEADISTFYLQTGLVPKGIPALFDELEKIVGSFKGRHLYGVSGCFDNQLIYRACILDTGHDEDQFGLDRYVIPKGNYSCTRLDHWRDHLAAMPGIFQQLLDLPHTHPGSICLEDYESDSTMLLMVQQAG